MEEFIPRLVYVFVFECEMCKQDVYAYFHAEDPELTFHLTCTNKTCGWTGSRRCTQAKRVSVRDLVVCPVYSFTDQPLSFCPWAGCIRV